MDGRREGGSEGRTRGKFPLISVIQWQTCRERACGGPHAGSSRPRCLPASERASACARHFRSYLMTSSMDLMEGKREREGEGRREMAGKRAGEMGSGPEMLRLPSDRPWATATAGGPNATDHIRGRERERASSCESNLASPRDFSWARPPSSLLRSFPPLPALRSIGRHSGTHSR